jgi:hypothetical protein
MFEHIYFGPVCIVTEKTPQDFHVEQGAKEGFFPHYYVAGSIHPDENLTAVAKNSLPEKYGEIIGYIHMIKPVKIDIC